jgi:hypothetical protein
VIGAMATGPTLAGAAYVRAGAAGYAGAPINAVLPQVPLAHPQLEQAGAYPQLAQPQALQPHDPPPQALEPHELQPQLGQVGAGA